MRNKPVRITTDALAETFAERLIGQPHVVERIRPYIDVFQGHASLEHRPIGSVLLLGPTGVGKTHAVELTALAMHGNERHFLRVDCGEFQMDHEVAKLIGAPPGYLGHRETQPMLNQAKLNSFTSERCGMSILLFDEIEKAAPSMQRLLLGVLDRATLKLGDNTSVNFERTLIFLTSNLGARDILRSAGNGLGFRGGEAGEISPEEMERVCSAALRKHFSPEFLNRIDERIPFRLLQREDLLTIARLHVEDLIGHLHSRWGMKFQGLRVPDSLIEELAAFADPAWGARELRRQLHRCVTVPLAQQYQRDNDFFARGPVALGGTLKALTITPVRKGNKPAAMAATSASLIQSPSRRITEELDLLDELIGEE